MTDKVKLRDCPIGLFLSADGALCMKTEYRDNNGQVHAYIVDSGEYFWGGTDTPDEQQRVMVTPVDARYLDLRVVDTEPKSELPDMVADTRRALSEARFGRTLLSMQINILEKLLADLRAEQTEDFKRKLSKVNRIHSQLDKLINQTRLKQPGQQA